MNFCQIHTFRTTLFALLFMVAQCCVAAKLPPAVEADRQMIAAKAAMDAKDWTAAVQAFDAAEATGVKNFPESFDYLFGKTLNEAGDPGRAISYLERYLGKYATKAKYYKEALEQVTLAEKGQAKLAAEAVQRDKIAKAWVKMRTRYAEMGKTPQTSLARDVDCYKTKNYIERSAKDIRNFSCSCDTNYEEHPAWRTHLKTVCIATWEGNLVINDTNSFHETNNGDFRFIETREVK
jgi:hypothetical protein